MNSIKHNAIKDDEFKKYAEKIADLDTLSFNILFDRVFNKFQEDPGVCFITPRYEIDNLIES